MTQRMERPATSSDESSGASDALRRLPAVHLLIERLEHDGWGERAGRELVAQAARRTINTCRAAIVEHEECGDDATLEALAQQAEAKLTASLRSPLEPIINATGVLLHTGLGRAPLAESAAKALFDVARGYAPVEMDRATGRRGRRSDVVSSLLQELTGAEAVAVVNNNAASLMLTLAAIARGKSVIVSRGELIEIGGSFRLPEVIEAGGASLKEVGATNKTRLCDYERAIDPEVAALMKVHTSNYRIEGFCESVSIKELADLGRRAGVPVIHDIGSGALRRWAGDGLPADEPDASASIAAGADLVLFSGDKLLGGPQAGIIIGRSRLIERIEAHPMMRAMRVGKLTLAALGATLQLHRDAAWCDRLLPVRAMLTASLDGLRQRAEALAVRFKELPGVDASEVVSTDSFVGGGAAPAHATPSAAVTLRARGVSVDELAAKLRTGERAVAARVEAGALFFDLRAVRAEEDELLFDAVASAMAAVAGRDGRK